MRVRRVGAALAGSIVLAACVYAFDNPVAAQPSGSIAGRLVLQGAAAGQSLDGGIIKLAWSGLTITLDANGGFEFLDLPDGTYTLVYQVPPVVAGDPPFVGVLRDVVIPAVSGQPDAVDLRTIQVAPAGTVVGTVVGGSDPVVIAFFHALDGGGEVFEGFSTHTADGGQFQLTIPAGDHILVASSATLSAEAPFTVGSLQSLQLPALALQPPVADGGSGVAGNMIFGGPGGGASATEQLVSSLSQSLAASDFPPLGGAVALQQQIPQVGLPFAQPVRPGRAYDFVCTLGAAQASALDGGTFDPLSIKSLPVIAGQPTNLGPVPWLPREVFDANVGARPPPSWDAIEGAPSLQTPADGAMPDGGGVSAPLAGGPVQQLLVIPIGPIGPIGSVSHLLVWTEQAGEIYFTSDEGPDGGFGVVFQLASGSVPSTLSGASDGDGGAVVAWGLVDGGIQIAAGYQPATGWTESAAFDAGEVVAVAAGGSVLFTTESSSTLELVTNLASGPSSLSAPAGTFSGVVALVAAPCQTDVADGLCLAWTDSQGLHGALADPGAGQITVGGAIASDATAPSTAQFIDPIAGTPYVVVAWLDGSQGLNWAYLTSMIDMSQWALQEVGVTSAGPALLLPWQGVPLAVYESSPDLTMATSSLPNGVVPSPVFPGDAGAIQAPAGYADSSGTLNLALIADGGPTLFQLAP
jgi:hypothetical protein